MKSIWLKKMLSGEGDPPESMKTEEEMLKKVALTPGAIGFVSQARASDEVKTLILIPAEVYTCLEGVDESQFDFPAVKKTMSQPSLEAVLSSAVGAHLVVPGQELAIYLGTRTDEPPRAGTGVDLNEGKYCSRQFGYLYAGDTEVSVLSPIWLAPDGMSAHYISLPQPVPAGLLTKDILADLLRLAGVTHGFDETALSRLVQDVGARERHASDPDRRRASAGGR